MDKSEALDALHHAIVSVRCFCEDNGWDKMTDRELKIWHAMDRIHNIPTFIRDWDDYGEQAFKDIVNAKIQ